MNTQKLSLIMRCYLVSYKCLRKLLRLLTACFNGFWLGTLKKETFHFIDEFYYANTEMYFDDAHNRRDLWEWEKKAFNEYFQKCRSVLVAGCGGGREVLALRRQGYYVNGFECNPKLLDNANELMRREGFDADIQLVSHDHCPDGNKMYDGIIIGWGTFMLIQGRETRIAFLKKLRSQVHPQSPILLSFFVRTGKERRFKIIKTVGNAIRWILGRNSVEIGDDAPTYVIKTGGGYSTFLPYYVHYFTKDEIAAELRDGGFELDLFRTEEYGHAVGIASGEERPVPYSYEK